MLNPMGWLAFGLARISRQKSRNLIWVFMILSGNYSLWFGEWHWNNNQESFRVPQSLKIIQKQTKCKGECLEAQANVLQEQKWQRWQTVLPWGSVNPRLQPHLSYSSQAPAVRATTKVSQCWGLCCNLWFPQSILGEDLESISITPTGTWRWSWGARAAGALKHYWEKLSDKRKTNKNDIIPVSFLACNTQRESHKELIILC